VEALNKLIALAAWSSLPVCLCAQVTLGPTVSTFAVLGGSAVTNTGSTLIGGNLGVSPLTAITGFPPGLVNGTIHSADTFAGQAQSDLTTAFNTAAGLPCGTNLTGTNLGGLTLTPGVYCFATTAQLTGILTLNALGNANAEFIFQIGSALTTASGSSVVLINQAQASNVYWETGTSATFGSTTMFIGNVLSLASISFDIGVSLQGRALAINGAVTLIGDNIFITGVSLPGAPAVTPAPPSLILITIGLVCAGLYQARERILNLIRAR
jgi:hypothetical protein